MDKSTSRVISQALRAILIEEWDPHGIADKPEAADVYDPYVGEIFMQIYNGCSEESLANYLHMVERDRIGMDFRSWMTLLPVAKHLIQTFRDLEQGSQRP